MKTIITIIVMVAAALYGALFIDDEINPEIVKLKKKYNRPVDLNANVYIELIRLGNDMSYEESLKLYHSKVSEASEYAGASGSEFLYPNIKKLASHEELENICEIKSLECREDIKSNKEKYEEIVRSLENTLVNYRKLEELDNFDPINSFYTEPNFEVLANLNKLAAVDIYLEILDKKNEIALSKLVSMLELDRKFLATSHEFIYDILFIVNMSERYAPLILALKQTHTKGLNRLLPLLTPLSTEELSMNRYFSAYFAAGTELLKFSRIVATNNSNSSDINALFTKRSYKENMTLNADYEFLKLNLIPTRTSKSEYFKYLDLRSTQLDIALENTMERPFFSIETIRNPIGKLMLEIKTPKFINIFEEKIRLDLTIILTRLLVLSDSQDLNINLKNEANINPYKDEVAFINLAGLLCFSTSKDVCIQVE